MSITKSRKQPFSFDQIIGVEHYSEHYSAYTVIGSKGDEYRVTTVDGVATGCDCPAALGNHKCYHRTGIESYIRFEQEWNAPIEQPVTVAEVWSQNDEGTHVVESIEEGEFEIEAEKIIAIEKRRAFEQVCAEVRKIEHRGRRERAALGPQERKIEQGPSGAIVLMRAS